MRQFQEENSPHASCPGVLLVLLVLPLVPLVLLVPIVLSLLRFPAPGFLFLWILLSGVERAEGDTDLAFEDVAFEDTVLSAPSPTGQGFSPCAQCDTARGDLRCCITECKAGVSTSVDAEDFAAASCRSCSRSKYAMRNVLTDDLELSSTRSRPLHKAKPFVKMSFNLHS